MATQVDIYNLALSAVGNRANVASLTEQSVERQTCDRYWPQCLRTILEQHPWSFAKARSALAAVTNDIPDSWGYKYAKPNLLVTEIALLNSDMRDDHEGLPYMLQGEFIYADESDAALLYIFYQDNTGTYSGGFVNALSCLLASRIAGPFIKGAMGRQERDGQYKAYLVELGQAKAYDANKSQDNAQPLPGGIAVRGGNALMAMDDLLSERRSRRL